MHVHIKITLKLWQRTPFFKLRRKKYWQKVGIADEDNAVYYRSSPSLCDICGTYAPHPWDIIPVTQRPCSHIWFLISFALRYEISVRYNYERHLFWSCMTSTEPNEAGKNCDLNETN